MKLGYACINMSMPSKFKSCRLKTVEEQGLGKVKEIAVHNLAEVIRALEWNIVHDIYFFRMSSDLIPFASHPIMTWEWQRDADILALTAEIGRLRELHDMRLSMHPGQYTIINSPREDVVEKAIAELTYHQQLLDLVGGTDMILHIGGAYGDKKSASERFIQAYNGLSEDIQRLLRLENDDKTYTAMDVLGISKATDATVCFDIHHHNCNHEADVDVTQIVTDVFKTWKTTPKMHISSGKTGPTDRSHHDLIHETDFQYLMGLLAGRDADIMFEAKQKERSVLTLRETVKW
ncbi:UV DNA damage repair endonuclease UvsE [Listeria booriae]|uniref:UV DNA damage repair endonuclease UvsE n=1 Tax=Listeria booriae TaxID=1552123 RepID=A0A842FF51_9LIST|nr:UV DNA damage repair endonuclease UvsE [Listeria booriae]MBC2284345.1 UV DNA damage repair endonuclease UvsE [Listeria booriae]MBC2292745.1 UV DNA damage repair endonuclease UvsE [Listeria booriae]